MNFRITSVFILAFVVFQAGIAWADRMGTTGKPAVLAEVAARGCVLDASGSEADQSLKQAKVVLKGGTQTHRDVIASALNTMRVRSNGETDKYLSAATGGRNGQILSINVQASIAGAAAGQATRNSITLDGAVLSKTANSQTSAQAEALVIHELGHVIQRRANFQGPYESAVGTKCDISTYCTHTIDTAGNPGAAHSHRREEFAEVFTAYLFNAQALQSKCPEAFKFMQEKVFKQPPVDSASCKATGLKRAVQRADGTYREVPRGYVPPGGSSVYTYGGKDGNGDAIWSALISFMANERARENQQLQQQNRPTTPANGYTPVAPEQWRPGMY